MSLLNAKWSLSLNIKFLWGWKKKWQHFCFKNVILISYLQNYKNKIVQYSQILIESGAFRADTIDTTQLANVHFVKEVEQELWKHTFLKSMLI